MFITLGLCAIGFDSRGLLKAFGVFVLMAALVTFSPWRDDVVLGLVTSALVLVLQFMHDRAWIKKGQAALIS
jgi:hypothetical protein